MPPLLDGLDETYRTDLERITAPMTKIYNALLRRLSKAASEEEYFEIYTRFAVRQTGTALIFEGALLECDMEHLPRIGYYQSPVVYLAYVSESALREEMNSGSEFLRERRAKVALSRTDEDLDEDLSYSIYYGLVTNFWGLHLYEESLREEVFNDIFFNPKRTPFGDISNAKSDGMDALRRAIGMLMLDRPAPARSLIEQLVKWYGDGDSTSGSYPLNHLLGKPYPYHLAFMVDCWYRAKLASDRSEQRDWAQKAMKFQFLARSKCRAHYSSIYRAGSISLGLSFAIEFDLHPEWVRLVLQGDQECVLDSNRAAYLRARELNVWNRTPDANWPSSDHVLKLGSEIRTEMARKKVAKREAAAARKLEKGQERS